jgi:ribulose-bisphosphate carboxylase large chain
MVSLGPMSSDRLVVTYRLTCAADESPEEKASGIALEQTVELPAECLPEGVSEEVVGFVEELEPDGEGWETRISYPAMAVGDDLPQLLNLLFGNISMKAGIRVEDVVWPDAVLGWLPGPNLGIEGIRALCGADSRRPLLCAALKPLGLSSKELAARARALALGGIDVIKDDHSLADQRWAPFAQRVSLCQAAVEQANRETEGSTLYFPNLSGSRDELPGRLERVRGLGCKGVMVSPMLLGFDTVRSMATDLDLALFGHPALTGAYFAPEHGIAPEILLGELFRLIGCDGVIYPNVGGRFVFGQRTCLAINDRLRRPLGEALPAFPMPGGGIDTAHIAEWIDRYGEDTMFLIGTALYREDDLERGAAKLVTALRRAVC